MVDRPMLFSGPMVRALIEARKTQTRRLIKLPTKGEYFRKDMGGWATTTVGGDGCFTIGRSGEHIPAPEEVAIWNQTTGTCLAMRYRPGDRIWVREAWKVLGRERDGDTELCLEFRADGKKFKFATAEEWGTALAWWRKHKGAGSPIHMPRLFSRLTLTVTEVRVERLNDISERDALREGMTFEAFKSGEAKGVDAKSSYAMLWDKLHGNGAWAANPWIVVVGFTVALANIDSLPKSEAARCASAR